MRKRHVRWAASLAGMALVGTTYQTGCGAFFGDQLFRTTDFCFVFDCQNGAFAGLFDPCPQNVIVTDDTSDIEGNTNLFVDCPVDDGM